MTPRRKAWLLVAALGMAGVGLAAIVASNDELRTQILYEEVAAEPTKLGPEMTYLEKRWHWLPGDETVIPSQDCGFCNQDRHEACSSGPNGETYVWTVSHGRVVPATLTGQLSRRDFPDFRCSCTHPSHQDE